MNKQQLVLESVASLSTLLAQRSISSRELMQAFIDRREAVDGQVGAFLSADPEGALAQADRSDQRRAKGEALSPLDGIPVGIKDILAVEGQPLTCASRILEHFISPYSATCTLKLQAAGLIPWGRLNMDEFAMGASTETSAFKKTANPWNLGYVPGGSSGGSAAALAAAEAPITIGSDTGGSIRQPAAFCGVVGLKPTYGRVSRYGLAAFASSLDQLGPMGRSVEDVAHLLGVMAGYDPKDSTSLSAPVPDYGAALRHLPRSGRLGVPKEYFAQGLDPEVGKLVRQAIEFYARSGFEVVEVSLPRTELAVATYYVIATAEASSNLARYDGVRYTHRSAEVGDAIELFQKSRAEGFGPEVKRRIILGTYVLSSGYYDAYYVRAQKVRSLLHQEFMEVFASVDAILGPTSPTAAFPFGQRTQDPLSMYLCDVYTTAVNLAGLPALSIPCGFTAAGLPVGLQLIGKPLQEASLMALARVYEVAHPNVRFPELRVNQ